MYLFANILQNFRWISKKMTCAVRSYVPRCSCDEVRMWVRKLRMKLRSRRRAKYFIAIVEYRCHGIPIGVEIGQPTSSLPQTAQKSNTIFWSRRMVTSLSRLDTYQYGWKTMILLQGAGGGVGLLAVLTWRFMSSLWYIIQIKLNLNIYRSIF